MNFCENCGSKLTQDGTCPTCPTQIKQENKTKSKKPLIIGISIGVVVLMCVIIGILLLPDRSDSDPDPIPKFIAEDYDRTGTCGEDAQWGFKEETGELTIIGTGKMEHYTLALSIGATTAPWGELPIKSVEIYGVTNIGDFAFSSCKSLTSVKIIDSVTTIGVCAFIDCESLTSVELGDGVMSIRDCAFADCPKLTSVEFSDSVDTIGVGAFSNCDSLTDVYYGGTEEQWNDISIETGNDILTNATIHYNS